MHIYRVSYDRDGEEKVPSPRQHRKEIHTMYVIFLGKGALLTVSWWMERVIVVVRRRKIRQIDSGGGFERSNMEIWYFINRTHFCLGHDFSVFVVLEV